MTIPNLKKGNALLDKLENFIKDPCNDTHPDVVNKAIPLHQVYLLKGKFYDSLKDYNQSHFYFGEAFKSYKENCFKVSPDAFLGNLQFRYGWAFIRSQKSIDRGIQILRRAAELA